MPKHYLLYTNPGEEVRAYDNLTRLGFRADIFYTNSDERDGKASRKIPCYPRYITAYLDDSLEGDDFNQVKFCPGVAKFVRFGTSYAIMPERVICDLRAVENDNGVIDYNLVYELYDELIVLNGIFEGHRALFQEMTNEGRVTAFVNLAGKDHPMEFGINQVQLA